MKNQIQDGIRKKGATLAETLITLAILGIVFVLSAGTMIADYKKNETVVRLKKIYSVLSQAFLQSEVLNGTSRDWNIQDGSLEYASNQFYNNYLSTVLAVNKDCKTDTTGECNYEFKELNGKQKSLSPLWTRFFLNDGTFIAIQTSSDANNKVVYFYVDNNGKKRLNVVARDIFLFEYWIQNNLHPEYEGKLLPLGHEFSRNELISDSDDNNCNSSKNGNYCGALIMKDSWQIINGYPWAQARYVVQ